MNIFISYDHRDEEKASKLENDLRSQRVAVWIAKKSIKPGKFWLKEIDEGLSNRQTDYVLGVVTENYIESTGMIEAYAKISEGLSKKDFKFIPLFFDDIEKIESTILKAIHGIKFTDYKQGLLDLIKFLKSEEPGSSLELLSKIEGERSNNPFRRTRAEYFKNDYQLATAFADPEKERYELVRGRTPLFIFGGRGSGKTMVLRSLTPEVIASRLQVKTFKEAKEKGVDYFGMYLRLLRGSFALVSKDTVLKLGFLSTGMTTNYDLYKKLWNKIDKDHVDEPIISAGINSAQRIFLDEINFKILITIVAKLKHLQTVNLITIDSETEQKIVSLIIQRVKPTLTTIRSFNDLLHLLNGEIDKIKDYLQKITLPFAGTPSVNWITSSPDFLDHTCKLFIDNIPG